jgi:ubiquitin-like protein Nedd8
MQVPMHLTSSTSSNVLTLITANRVRIVTGKEIELDIEPECTVAKIKEHVEEKEGVLPPQQTLLFDGKQMSDDKTASEYELQEGATLQLILALRG